VTKRGSNTGAPETQLIAHVTIVCNGPAPGAAVWAAGEPACRPGSVHPPEGGPAAIHLGLPLPAASCGLPASIGRAALQRSRRPAPRRTRTLLTLLQVGFTKPPGSLRVLVVSYTTVSPLPRDGVLGRFVFCGTFPRVTPGRRYRPPRPAEPGPSSPDRSLGAAARPARPPPHYGLTSAAGDRCR
jgi:hypothetical protein